MNKLFTIITAMLFAFSSWHIQAAPSDVPTSEAPPAQMQKDKVPDSTTNGNYLEPQPDVNGVPLDPANPQDSANKGKKNSSKPSNLEKNKKLKDPADGGVQVK